MAILQQGSLGVFTGKIGALVIAKWKSKYVGRGAPKKSSKEATVLQLTNYAIWYNLHHVFDGGLSGFYFELFQCKAE